MGYYSEVAIALTKHGYDHLQAKLDNSNFDPEEKGIEGLLKLFLKILTRFPVTKVMPVEAKQ